MSAILNNAAALIGAAPTPFNDLILYPGDIVLTSSRRLMGRLVRFFTGSRKHRATVNHAALVTIGGFLQDASVTEALMTVKEHSLWQKYADSGMQVSIWRPYTLTDAQRRAILLRASHYVGRPYGSMKLIPHALDWLLGRRYIFRRLARVDEYPICSWLVAYAFTAAGLTFGVPPNSASPEDIAEYVAAHPEQYLCVLPLQEIRKWQWIKSPGEV